MSLQIAILKVLGGFPEGRAAIPELNRAIATLDASGSEWSDRIRRMAARAPNLDIFGEGFVARDARVWQITAAGRQRLRSLEAKDTPLVLIHAESGFSTDPVPNSGGPVISNSHPAMLATGG